MAGHRSRKEALRHKQYVKAHPVKDGCEFCYVLKEGTQLVKKGQHFSVLINIFPYSLWDEMKVDEHLMIVPHKHTDTLSSLSSKEAVEYVSLLGEYDQKGYSSYARAPGLTTKSIAHHHTHLIKTENKRLSFLFHIKKPYFRISF